MKSDGIKGFYKGISAAWFRQATYGTARLGLYKYIFEKEKEKHGEVNGLKKIEISLVAGLIASLIGNPSDLALVRFQSDSYLPLEERRNYRN